jgi:hypothetical protein
LAGTNSDRPQQLSDIFAADTATITPALQLLDGLAEGFFLRLRKSLWTPVMRNPCYTVQTFIDKPL